jgi:hypothetical protein
LNGAKNIGRVLDRFGPRGRDLTLAGLYDAAEEPDFRRGLERAGFGSDLSRADLERLGFHACVEDLEDELIAAVGVERVVRLIESHGDARPLRTLQRQDEWRDRPLEHQIRRFIGSGARRKLRYARVLGLDLAPARVPHPLRAVLGDD